MTNLPSTHLKSNRNLVTISHGKPTTTSLLIAETFQKRHGDVLRAIEKLDCSPSFNRRNFTSVEYLDAKGESRPMYRVTRDGFTFLAMGFRGMRAAQFKEQFIGEFNRMEKALARRKDQEFIEARNAGKVVRRMETDSIAQLVAYAKTQGSWNADRYFLAFTKLTYKALGLDTDGSFPVRDYLPPILAAKLAVIEAAVSEVIEQGITAALPYKAVYQAAAARVLELATVLTPAMRLLAA